MQPKSKMRFQSSKHMRAMVPPVGTSVDRLDATALVVFQLEPAERVDVGSATCRRDRSTPCLGKERDSSFSARGCPPCVGGVGLLVPKVGERWNCRTVATSSGAANGGASSHFPWHVV